MINAILRIFRRKVAVHVEWTEADQENETRLYNAGKSAFWLYPERWKGVRTGECMNFDPDGDKPMPAPDGASILASLASRREPVSKPIPYATGKPKQPPARKPILATDLTDGGLDYALGRSED